MIAPPSPRMKKSYIWFRPLLVSRSTSDDDDDDDDDDDVQWFNVHLKAD